MPQVDVAVGIRRPIVKDIFIFPLVGFKDFKIHPAILPFFHLARFVLGKVCAHGKARFWKVESLFIIHSKSERGGLIETRQLEAGIYLWLFTPLTIRKAKLSAFCSASAQKM